MEQIYYTQCPIGYGLGASNGFQIKRLSPEYPLTGDFRHLSLKAFLPGTRHLAPGALRYRRDGEVAEVAWLTPRSHEYETENGRLWGRPGGQFAHGLRLTREEMAAIGRWPAGLYDRAFWRRSDPEPTRGRPPEAVVLDPTQLLAEPTFAAIAALAGEEDEETLARLLTAAAHAVREGRTLFLIDEHDRIGRRIALLTFAVPERMRPALTFSTYHDRPEELFGFRIQATIPAAKPNRAALVGLGIVADLTSCQFEPRIEPARWARTLVRWMLRHEDRDEAAWTETCQVLAERVVPMPAEEVAWSDAWLNHLVGFREMTRSPAPRPDGAESWAELVDFAGWATQSGLTADWAAARPPRWWRDLAPEHTTFPEARRALLTQAKLREVWRTGTAASSSILEASATSSLAAEWGDAVALWFGDRDRDERVKAVSLLLKHAPAESRSAFLAALIRRSTPDAAEEILDRLRANPTFDEAMLLPLDAARAAKTLVDGGEAERVVKVLLRAAGTPAAMVDVLNAVAFETDSRPEALPRVAPAMADALDRADGAGWEAAWSWALARDRAADWLAVYLHRLFSQPGSIATWRLIHRKTPRDLRPNFARTALQLAMQEGLPEDAFLWGVEELLLPLPESDRPHDVAWPEAYLKRVSGLDLARWLFLKDKRKPELLKWLSAAIKRKEVPREHVTRLKACQAYALALESGDAEALRTTHLPDVPARERGALLQHLLERVGETSSEHLGVCLDSCRRAWPGAFDPGASGLEGLAIPLARWLFPCFRDHRTWFERLGVILDRLGQRSGPLRGFEPDGLASEIAGATAGLATPETARWPLRQFLFRQPDAWRILAADARQDLRSPLPEHAVEVLDRWDHRLEKGKDSARFFELLLNVSKGPALAALVSARAPDLLTLGVLPWWGSSGQRGTRNDIREAFARLAPMSPLPEDTLHAVRTWMRRADPSRLPTFELDGVLEPTHASTNVPVSPPASLEHLSSVAQARWRCLEAISAFSRSGLDVMARWESIRAWIDDPLPIDVLDEDDLHRFLAAVILRIDHFDEAWVARLARWVVRGGLTDANRVKDWAGDILGQVSNETLLKRMEFVHELKKEIKTRLVEARDRRHASRL